MMEQRRLTPMKPPTEFLQGLGIGAGLIAVMAAISLLVRTGVVLPFAARPAKVAKPIIEPRGVSATSAHLSPDYLDLCRNAGL